MKDLEEVAPHPVLSEYYTNADQRRQKVDEMFDSSAVHYDRITNMMSFGSGPWYRKQALIRTGVRKGHNILDVGAGTGVVSLISQELVGPEGSVIALDPSHGMLSVAAENGVQKMVQGLGETLPLPDNTFDFVTMGYALRHVADLNALFAEFHRVLKPGGKILLLEITRPSSKLGSFLLKVYMKGIIPLMTRIFCNSKKAQELMKYYWDTTDKCVRPEKILQALIDQNTINTNRHIVLGVFSEYTAEKPSTDNSEA